MKNSVVILITPKFKDNYKKLPENIKKKAVKKQVLFQMDPFSPNLKTHKLSGKLEEYWSFSIDYHYRIVFRFISKSEVLFVDVGTHGIYKV